MSKQKQNKSSGILTAGSAEYNKIVYEWNKTETPYPVNKTVHQLFEEQVKRTPDNTALIFYNKEMTYSELNQKVNQLAHTIRHEYKKHWNEEIKNDTLIGIYLECNLEMIIGILAVLKSGAAYVPFDIADPRERLKFKINDCKCKMILTSSLYSENLISMSRSDTLSVAVNSYWDEIKKFPKNNPLNINKPADLAYIIYTSGSAGKPKGVMVEHRALVNQLKGLNYCIPPGNTLFKTKICFDASIWEYFYPLTTGHSAILLANQDFSNTAIIRDFILKYNINILQFTPTHFYTLSASDNLFKKTISQINSLCFGGEPINPSLVEHITTNIYNLYGPTECCIQSNIHKINKKDYSFSLIGKRLINYKNYILDKDMNPVLPGKHGELYIGGDGLARGYLNNDQLTRDKFIRNPFATDYEKKTGKNLIIYKTGDIARWMPDGNIEFIGRTDDQIKIRGNRIELNEIKSILEQHPAISQCIISIYQHNLNNDEVIKQLCAYYVLNKKSSKYNNDESKINNQLRKYLSTFLPEYMIPSFLIRLKDIPLTPSGKVNKNLLPAPEINRMIKTNYIAPENEVEKILSEIWCNVLNLKQVGINDNFFHIGGDSLSAVKVALEIKKKLGININSISLSKYPTIKKWSKQFNNKNNELFKDTFLCETDKRYLKKFSLSEIQNNIWFDILSSGNNLIYNEHLTVEINEDINKSRLETCINLLISHHEQLRTRFEITNNKISQIVEDHFETQIKFFDLTVERYPERKFKYYANMLVKQTFNLNQLPLTRFYLFKSGNNKFRLFIVFHHIIADAVSFYRIFLPVLQQIYDNNDCYNSFKKQLPDISYNTYVLINKNNTLCINSKNKYFWKIFCNKYKPTKLSLYEGNKNLPLRTGSHLSFKISESNTNKLKTIAKANNVSLFTVLLSIFYLILYEYTGNNSICINSVIDDRENGDLTGLFGVVLQNIFLAIDIEKNISFPALLQQVHNRNINTYKHKIPYNSILKNYRLKTADNNPLNIGFNLQPYQKTNPENWTYSQSNADAGSTKNDFYLEFDENNNKLTGRIDYSKCLYSKTAIQQFISNFKQLVSNIASSPDKLLYEYSLLSQAEYNKIIHEWNKTEAPYPEDKTIHQLFAEQAARTPDNIALIFEDQQMTYKELNEKSDHLADWIRLKYKKLYNKNLMPDTLIPVCAEKSLELITGILGILKAGAAYVPIDPGSPENRIKYILQDTDARLVLTQKNIASKKSALKQIPAIIVDAPIINQQPSTDYYQQAANSRSLAYVIYTSGSTGQPKGVMIEHKNLINNSYASLDNYNITDADNILQFSNISFDISIEEIFPCLITGSTLILKSKNVITPHELMNLVKNAKITFIDLPTSYWNTIVNHLDSLTIPDSLRLVVLGGEKVAINKYLRWYNFIYNKVQLINSYGPTETTVIATIFKTELNKKFFKKYTDIPIGKPIHNAKLYILNQLLNVLPVGIKGELYIGGDGIARGYLNNDKLTEEKFIKNPFATNEEIKAGKNLKLYKTGDMVRWLPDGNIEFIDRMDNQVKILGNRIEPGEIENNLSLHPMISQSAVNIHETINNKGQINKQLSAYYVLSEDYVKDKNTNREKTKNELRQYLKNSLPDYMIPAFFIQLDRMPLTSSGKIDKKSLPAPDVDNTTSGKYTAPKRQTEKALVRIWQHILNLKRLSIHDNFFHIGGNSLLTIDLISEINEKISERIKIKDIFDYPTIYKLADFIDHQRVTTLNFSKELNYYKSQLNKINFSDAAKYPEKPVTALLTGVSGFLGIYLLETLINYTDLAVYCIIRGKNRNEIHRKLLDNLKFYHKEYLLDSQRIFLIKGNLKEKNLGLSKSNYKLLTEKIDIIYHNGANVNHIYNYETLKDENVNSTFEIIKIASAYKLKKINFISTYDSAFLPGKMGKFLNNTGGYLQTKYISEQILRQARNTHIPVTIFRPGNITGDSQTGKSNYTANNSLLLLKSCIQSGCAPNWKNETIEMTPVNILSRAIIELSLKISSSGKIYNLNNPSRITWLDYISIINSSGYNIKIIDINRWKEMISHINHTNALFPLKEYYMNYQEPTENEKTGIPPCNDLKKPDIVFPENYQNMVKLYVEYLQKVDFLPMPEGS